MDPTTCATCNHKFADKHGLQRHLNKPRKCGMNIPRKTTQCGPCGEILSRHDSLVRHLKTCKVANKPVEDHSELAQLRQRIAKLESDTAERLNLLADELRNRPPPAVNNHNTINNITNINTTVTNNYLTPSVEHIISAFADIFEQHPEHSPIKIVPIIWFNPECPENLSIYLVNKNTHELSVYDGKRWISVGVEKVSLELRNIAYSICLEASKKTPRKNVNDVRHEQMVIDHLDPKKQKSDTEDIYNQFVSYRSMVEPYTKTTVA